MCNAVSALLGPIAGLFGGGSKPQTPAAPPPLPDPNATVNAAAEADRKKRQAAAAEQQDQLNPTGGGLSIGDDLLGKGKVKKPGLGGMR
ncbi:MAG: hypothetical protein AAF205_00025 [Pseudomonadota bacterium]